MLNFPGIWVKFLTRKAKFPTISYVFLYSVKQNFPGTRFPRFPSFSRHANHCYIFKLPALTLYSCLSNRRHSSMLRGIYSIFIFREGGNSDLVWTAVCPSNLKTHTHFSRVIWLKKVPNLRDFSQNFANFEEKKRSMFSEIFVENETLV